MLRLYVKAQLARRALVDRIAGVLRNDKGATVSEYALVLALVTVAVIGVLSSLGTTLSDKINEVKTAIETGVTP